MSLDVNHFLSDEQFKEKIKKGSVYLNTKGDLVEYIGESTDPIIYNGSPNNQPHLISIPRSLDRFLKLKREIEIDKIL